MQLQRVILEEAGLVITDIRWDNSNQQQCYLVVLWFGSVSMYLASLVGMYDYLLMLRHNNNISAAAIIVYPLIAVREN